MLSRIARLAGRIGLARARHLLVICGLVIGVVLAASMIWFVVTMRQLVIADAERELRNDALMLAEAEDRILQAVDVVQLGLIEHMREMGVDTPEQFETLMGSEETQRNLRDRAAGLYYIGSLALSNRSGKVINTSRRWPPQAVNDADRDFIRALTADDGPKNFISGPSRSRSTGEWTIYLSRRFESRDRRLIGFVISTIRVGYFEQFYARLPLTGAGAFALYRGDGVLMARYPHVDPLIGRNIADTDNFRRVLAALDEGVVQLRSVFDGRERLIAPVGMPHFPFFVAVSDSVHSILGVWSTETRMFGFMVGLLELALAATILLAVRHLHGYEKLQTAEAAQARAEVDLALSEARERASQTLRTQQHRFDVALHNMLQGLLLISHSGHLLVVNRRFFDLFGMPRDSLTPGISYREMTDRVVELGNVCAADMQGVRDRRAALLARNVRAVATWELSDGRAFNVTHQPMDEGWLTTFEDITERRLTEAKLVHLAHHDALTDLPNRVLFRQNLEHALAFARRGRMLALLCLGLDQFKTVNDTLGHPVGDSLLTAVARRLASEVRDTDTVARLGGDEFAIIQTAIAKPTEATVFADRLVELLGAPFEVDGHQIVAGVSIGLAFAPHDGTDADQLLRCSDLAMHRAKADGRGIYRLFHAEMDAEMQARRLLELDLRQAVERGQLELFYQPQVSLCDRSVTGFEALLRWRHPERGNVSPGEFVPLAEEIGLIGAIGEWVLQKACRDAAGWPRRLKVAVNLSSVQFRSRDVVAEVTAALRASELSPDRLELEITETVMLEETEATFATLRELHGLGVRIAMDDFGTGYSSLGYLLRFPFDRIKIDQSFVRELGTRRDCGAIVRAVAALSDELGIDTTIEGVETRKQLDAVAPLGFSEVQGYLFGAAVPVGQVPGLLLSIPAIIGAPRVTRAEPVLAPG